MYKKYSLNNNEIRKRIIFRFFILSANETYSIKRIFNLSIDFAFFTKVSVNVYDFSLFGTRILNTYPHVPKMSRRYNTLMNL